MKLSKSVVRCIAIMLLVSLMVGMVPEGCIGLTAGWLNARAEAQAAEDAAQPVSDRMTSDSGWIYRICADGYAMVLGHADPSVQKLSIPSSLDGVWVVRIGENAFADNAALSDVFIPGTITQIADTAFSAQSGLNVRAYNGAGALAFAAKRGLDSQNLSDYDFFDDLIDLSELSSSQWSLESRSSLRISGAMSLRMKPDTKFFIPPCASYSSGLPATVESVVQKEGYVLVRFSELSFAGAVERYEVHNARLVPDMDNIVLLNEGVTLANSVATRASDEEELSTPVSFDIDFKVKMGGTSVQVTGGYTFTPGYTLSLEYEWFKLKSYSHSATNTHDSHITLKAEASSKTPITPGTDAKLQETQRLMDSLLKKPTPAKEEPLAVIPLKSGLISVNVKLSLVLSLSGEVTVHSVVETSETFSVNKETGEETRTKSKKIKHMDANIAVNGGIEFELALVGTIGFNDTKFSMDFAEIAISLKLNFSAKLNKDTPTCCDISIDLIFKVSAEVGVLGGKAEKDSDIEIDLVFGGEIFKLKVNIWKKHYEALDNKWTDKCTEDYCEVTFASYYGTSPDPVKVRANYTVEEPELPERRGYVLDGWYLDKPAYEKKWDFSKNVVTEDIILHAKWTRSAPTAEPSATPTVTPAPTATPTPAPGTTETPAPGETTEPTSAPTVDPDLDIPAYRMPDITYDESIWGILDWSLYGSRSILINGFKEGAVIPSSLYIPNTYTPVLINCVVTVGANAFANCTELKYVNLQCDVKSGAFSGCTGIETLVLGGGAYDVGYSTNAFAGCTSLTSVIWQGYSEPRGNNSVSGVNAFSDCPNLKVVYLNADIDLGKVFQNCTSLKAVVSNGGVITSLDKAAFSGCTGLQKVALGTTSIPDSAFMDCTSLTSFTIPSSVTSIGSHSFEGCTNLERIIMAEEGVTVIGDYAFRNCSGLWDVSMSESVTRIGKYAFENCTALNDIILTDNVQTISEYAFYGCSALESVDFPDNTLLTIGRGAFGNCHRLKSVAIPYADIGREVFYQLAALSEVYVDSGRIGNYAFAECPDLQCVEIGSGVTYIGENAFVSLPSIDEINVLAENLQEIDSYAFANCVPEEWELNIGCNYINTYAFLNCTSLEKLTLKGNDITISKYAFHNTGLQEVVINGSVKSMNAAFGDCAALRALTVYGDVQNFYFECFAYSSSLEQVHVFGDVASIGSKAFQSCYELKDFIVDGYIEKIGDNAFDNCTSLKNFEQKGVKSIGNNAFLRCTSLKNINLGETLSSIGSYAFGYCTDLRTVEHGNALVSIGSWAFNGCNSLENFDCGSSLDSIDSGAFYNCSALESIKLPAALKKIGGNAFSKSGLREVTLPGTIGAVDSSVFAECANLERVEIGHGITAIGNDAFAKCAALTEVILPATLTSLEARAFENCTALASIELPSSLTTLGVNVFSYCSSLKEVYLPQGVTTLPNYAFQFCTALQKIELPNTLTTIGWDCFYKCTDLEEIHIPGSVTNIDKRAFGYSGLKRVTFSDGGGITFGSYVFENCASLESVVLPEGLTSLNRAFSDCYKLTSAHLPKSLTTIDMYSFDGCYALQSIVIPDNITSIGNCAFRGTSLQQIVLPRSVTSVGVGAFNLKYGVMPEYIVIPREVTDITIGVLPEARQSNQSYYIITERGSAADEIWSNGGWNEEVIYMDEAQLVQFNAMGGSDVQSVYVDAGSLVPMPETPVREEYEFTGWFADQECTRPWNFASDRMPLTPLKLYAGWEYAPSAFVYELSGGEATLTGYRGKDSYVVIPETLGGCPVTAIAGNVFYDGVRSVTIPAGVNHVDAEAFRWADHLYEILVAEGNAAYSSQDGVLYTTDGALVRYPSAKYTASFTPAEGTTAIGSYAFAYACSVGEISLPESVTTAGSYAFYHCDALQTLSFPESLTGLDASAVFACPNLKYVSFAIEPQTLGKGCFVGSSDDLFIDAPADADKLFELADRYHFACNEYAVVYYSDGAAIGQSSARAGSILPVPPMPPKEKYRTFSGWSIAENGGLWEFETGVMPAEKLSLYAVWTSHFTCESAAEGDGVIITEWTGGSEDGTYHIPSEIDGQPVTDIADDCIPAGGSVTISGDKGSAAESYAQRMGFGFVPCLYTVRFETNGGSPVSSLRASANESITAPETIRSGYHFDGWYQNKALSRAWDFENDRTPARDLTLYAAWTAGEDAQDVPFTFEANNDGLTITGYTGSSQEVIIPESINGITVTEIGSGAFQNDDTVFVLDVPGSVQRVGSRAFAGSRLDRITFHDGTLAIGSYAFEECPELSAVVLADTIMEIGAGAFQGCSALAEITLPEALTTLSMDCFAECSSLMTAVLPAGLETIASGAFEGCGLLRSISLGEKLNEVAADAFCRCNKLAEISVDDQNSWYTAVDGVLLSADGAALILYPAGKTTGDYVLPESVTTIQNGAMAASRIQNLTLNESLVSIQNGALAGSISLESITFAENGCLEEIHSDAFSGCTALRALAFPDSLLYIGSDAFALCRLTDVVLGENTMLGSKAIPAWNGLTIYGTSGSEAEAYADEWKIRFIKETDVPVTAVSLETETLALTPGERMQLTAVLSPADTTETRLIWTSSDHTVAAVDESGCITARSTGEAIITAQAANGSIAQCTVSVKKTEAVAESITLNAASIALTPGNTMQLLAIVAPAEAARTTQLSWQSSDEKVARYVNGRVVAIAEGEATIACITANGLIATCRITVGDVLPPEVIEPDLIEPDLLLPAALKMIAEEAFAGGAFAAVQIPEGANEIGKRAFADCKGLVQISIPDSVTTIADDAFEGCSTVLFICSEGSAAQLYADAKGFAWVDN